LTGDGAKGSRANNFDGLRFLAATLVIVSHSFVLTGSTFEPLATATGGYETLGGLGVAIFFVMSGFLITESWKQDPRPLAFFAKRILRIVPALAAAILFAALVLGPARSSLGPRRYFSAPATWDYLSGLSIFRIRYFLPGVFESNPFPRAVNGSLWTIPFEAGCYVAVGVLGWLGLFPRRFLLLLLLLGLILLDWRPWAIGSDLGRGLSGAWVRSYARYASDFFAGALLCLMPQSVIRSPALALVVLLAFLSVLRTSFAPPIGHLAIPILVLFAGFIPIPALQGFGRFGDFSYGMYLYAFPIQQCLVEAVPAARAPAGLFALSLPLTLAMAAVSWHCLENPALRLKTRIPRPRAATLGG
jgi:peptidoglycan/LPS O-acetylase OafA/YrhL